MDELVGKKERNAELLRNWTVVRLFGSVEDRGICDTVPRARKATVTA